MYVRNVRRLSLMNRAARGEGTGRDRGLAWHVIEFRGCDVGFRSGMTWNRFAESRESCSSNK